MASLNRAELIGRLGKDPEAKTLASGSTYVRFSVATSDKWTDKDGKKQEKTEWHNIVVWNKTAEACATYLKKGSQVYVEGKIQTRSWDDNGVKKYATEILATVVQFLSPAGGGSNKNEAPEPEEPAYMGGFNKDDEIPF